MTRRPPAGFRAAPVIAAALALLAASCRSVPALPPAQPLPLPAAPPPEAAAPALPAARPPLRLTFAGDIMAHAVNFSMDEAEFPLIYRDIEPLLRADDASFANMETPVCAARPYETYPTFNVQPPYADAAARAGFDVFSLANNHTNDQGAEGIAATWAYFAGKEGVYAAGIRAPEGGEALSFQIIERNGWRVLFAAVTELLNAPRPRERIDYFPPEAREALFEAVRALRREHPCDLLVLSVHSGEAEYIRTVSGARREFYARLAAAGADVVWANHVHTARGWERVAVAGEGGGERTALVFYSAGNTISGQRTSYTFADPGASRDYTGDGALFCAEFADAPGGGVSARVETALITTWRDEKGRCVIRRLTEGFAESLRAAGRAEEAAYFAARKALMEALTREF